MVRLRDLPGVRRKVVNAEYVKNLAEVGRALSRRAAATASGASGALNIWRDDDGDYRCEFHRYKQTMNSTVCTNRQQIARWWKTWAPKLTEEPTHE